MRVSVGGWVLWVEIHPFIRATQALNILNLGTYSLGTH